MSDLCLITIPISHYCEKARWALDRAGLPFREERHLQIFHLWPAYRAGGGDSVPVLVTPTEVISDSTDIMHWVDARTPVSRRLFLSGERTGKQVEELESQLDAGLGVAGRLWMYTYMLGEIPLIIRYSEKHGIPWHQLKALPFAFPLIKKGVERALGAGPSSRSESKAEVDRTFAQIASRLSDGRPYLTSDRFTAADLTFAALAASVLIPADYGVALPALEELPDAMRKQVLFWREHPAGKFAQRMYRQHRREKS